MKVVLLTSDSPAQRALARRFDTLDGVELAGVLVQEVQGTRRAAWVKKTAIRHPWRLVSKGLQRTVLARPLHEILRAEGDRFGPGDWPSVATTTVTDVNGPAAVDFVRSLAPDVLAVSGTRIVKEPIFAIDPPLGLLNLHTGISPFVKGGPNCTLWCLADRRPQLIGATIHVLDRGIDSGPIITSAQLTVTGDETPGELVAATTELGHQLYTDVISLLATTGSLRGSPQQELGEGRTYYTAEWDVRKLAQALWYIRSGGLRRWVADGRPGATAVRLVPLRASS